MEGFTTDYSEELVKRTYQDLYWNQGNSIRDISRKLKIPRATVYLDFVKFNIRTRTKTEARKMAWKKGKYKNMVDKYATN